MDNFFTEIENEFSRARGKSSIIAPIDWQLLNEWQEKNIPLPVILRAMGDVAKNFRAQNSKGTINTLRYFAPEVEKQFADWQQSQVGKSNGSDAVINEVEPMQSYKQSQYSQTDDNIEILENLVNSLSPEYFRGRNIHFPTQLGAAVAQTRSEILALMSDAKDKQLSSDTIENRLKEIADNLNSTLVAVVPEADRQLFEKDIAAEYAKFKLTPELHEKVYLRKLYQRCYLPELTLFAF